MSVHREACAVDKVNNNVFSAFTGTSNSENRFYMDYYKYREYIVN